VIGSRLGPYLIERELGTGGMGTVYAAQVTEEVPGLGDRKQAAVKVVHAHLLEARGFFKRFLKEAEIGRQVRHPCVVRTCDVDAVMVDGKMVHYMVMEFVEGRTLRTLLSDLGAVPESLLREIARQIASGLSAIHGAGIVHRDLKPENVLITPDDQVKIMDLGVARLMEESVALTRQGQFAGSLLYAAPEQFGGRGGVGPHSDLYSLGVLLHELATGANPFLREGPAAVMTAHLTVAPPRLSDVNPEISHFLAEVVGTLLRKDPAERFASAAELLALLEQGEASAWWGQREKVLLREEGHLPRIGVRRETGLHGREPQLSLLREAWEQARDGRGSMVLVEGEAGIGKTRLLDAFLEDFRGVDAHVLYGSYPPSGGMGGITDALVGKFGSAGMEEALRGYLTVTPRLVPAFAALVQHQAPPPGSEPLTPDGFHAVFVHLLKALAAEKPVLWLVEDLHSAPPDSRAVVLSLGRAVDGQRVLLVATSRPGIPEDEMAHFGRLPAFRRTELARLGARQVMELLKDAFRSTALAERLGGKIALKSDGVPFFVFELIRGLKEGNYIRRRPDGAYVETQVISEIQVPSAVRDLIEGRLRGISDEDRNLLDVASVQGIEFSPRLVATVCEMRPLKALQRIAALERSTGVVRGSGDSCRFDHNQIQEVLYESLLKDLREEYHAALADAYAEREGVGSRPPAEVPGEAALFLARHHLWGSRPRGALPFLDRALAHLAGAERGEALLEVAERALARPGLLAGAARVRVLLEKAGRLTMLGKVAATEAALAEAKRLSPEVEDPALRARILLAEAAHAMNTARFSLGRKLNEEAAALAEAAGDARIEAHARNGEGLCRLNEGDLDGAERAFEATLEIARRIGDRGREGGTTNNLAILAGRRGHRREAEEGYRRALALVTEAGHARFQANIRGNLATFDVEAGRLSAYMAEEREVLRLQRELGNRASELGSATSLADVLGICGRFEEAEAFLEEAARIAREGGNRDFESVVEAQWGAHLERKGDPGAAEGRFRAAHSMARESGSTGRARANLRDLAGVLAELGRRDEALALVREADAIPAGQDEDGGPVRLAFRRAILEGDAGAALDSLAQLQEVGGVLDRMRARWDLWGLTGDREHAREAHRLLLLLRDNAPEDDRGRLMEKVPLHRRIAEAAAGGGAAGSGRLDDGPVRRQ
jgi:tetratricopeptide (TPR) repeat protein